MKNKTKKKLKLKLSVRLALLAISIILFTFSIFIIFTSLGYFDKKEKELLVSYQINNELNYQVHLKENDFIENKILGMNEMYISELIDYIEINYSSLFQASKLMNLNYNYIIKATIYGEYQISADENNSKIWEKEYILQPQTQEKQENKNNINNNQHLEIDLTQYQNEVSEFQKTLKLPMTTKLIIKFISNINNENNENIELNENVEMEIAIPLNEKVFTITTNYQKNKSENIYNENIDYSKYINYPLLVFAIGITAISLYILYKNLKPVLKVLHKSEYIKSLNKILKEYDEIIVNLAELPDINNYQIIEVETFEELMDLEEELRIPILHYEKIKNKESWFIIIHNQIAYRYILYNK